MSSDKSMFDARHPPIGGCDERQGLGLGETGTALQLRRHQEIDFLRYCLHCSIFDFSTKSAHS
jgi:hypothetical protein